MLLFISDLHLDEQRPDITAAFLDFLAHQATEAKALYILGDLFEVWIGDDGMDSYQQGIARALKQLSARGVSIFVLHGNRDFMLGQAFCRAAGCQLLAEETVIHIDGQRALLMHGDTLCTQDVRYLRKRRQLRNPISLWILRHLPLNYRQRLARNLRAASRQHTRLQPADIVDVTPEAVTQRMRQHHVRLLIHGHTHRPAVHSLQIDGQECQRIVLGDWDQQAWVLVAQEGRLQPRSFPLPPQTDQAASAPL